MGSLLPDLLDLNDVRLLSLSALRSLSRDVIVDDRFMVCKQCLLQDVRCFDCKPILWYRASRNRLLRRLVCRLPNSLKLEVPCDEVSDLGDSVCEVEVLVQV